MFLDSIILGFDKYKENLKESFIFGLAKVLIEATIFIPIVGFIIVPYFYPRILRWYSKKLDLFEKETSLKTSFYAIFLYTLFSNLALLFLIFGYANLIVRSLQGYPINFFEMGMPYFEIFLILIVISSILSIIFKYTVYSNVLGIMEEFKVDFVKSLKIVALQLVIGIFFGFISFILSYIEYGDVLSGVLAILLASPWTEASSMIYAKNLSS